MMRLFTGIVMSLALMSVAACSTPRTAPPPTPSVGGDVTSCVRACNRDYSICGESAGARRGTNPLFGAAASCDRQLESCLDYCRAIPVPSIPGDVPNAGQ